MPFLSWAAVLFDETGHRHRRGDVFVNSAFLPIPLGIILDVEIAFCFRYSLNP